MTKVAFLLADFIVNYSLYVGGSLSALVRVFVVTPSADRAHHTIRLQFSTLLPNILCLFQFMFLYFPYFHHVFRGNHARESECLGFFHRLLQNMIIKNMRPSRIHNYGVRMIARGELHRFFLMTNERNYAIREIVYTSFMTLRPRLKRDIMRNTIFRSLKA